jgi:hypothetical protein
MFIEGGSKSNETVLMSLTVILIWMKFLFLLIKWEFQVETIWRKQPKEKNNMKTIYSITIFFSLLLAGCTSEPTLQKYFVENTENKDFIVRCFA